MQNKEKLLIRLIQITLILFFVVGLVFLFISVFNPGIVQILISLVFLGIALYFFSRGFRSIPNEKRWVIEVFGRFYGVMGPGLVWLCPFLMKARESVPLPEQRYRLYDPETDHNIKIDFKDGAAAPIRAFAFVQVIGAKEIISKQAKGDPITPDDIDKLNENIMRAVYASDDTKRQSVTLIENMTRSYLNSLTIEQGVTLGSAGYNLIDGIKSSPDTVVQNGLRTSQDSLAQWGVELHRVTMGDFELSNDVIAARSRVLQMQKEAEAAMHRAKTLSTTTVGAKLQMLSEWTGKPIPEIQAVINGDPELTRAFNLFSDEVIKMNLGYEAKSRYDIGVQGAEGGLKDILTIIMAALTAKK